MDHNLAEALVTLVNETGGDAAVVKNYSGRGMYGKETTGISGTTEGELLCTLLDLIHGEAQDDLAPLMYANNDDSFDIPSQFNTDSLGHDTIIY